jgi:hypothetical protein
MPTPKYPSVCSLGAWTTCNDGPQLTS